MTPDTQKDLEKEDKSEFHTKLLDRCLADVKKSRGHMSKNYRQWDLQDQVYRGERWPDKKDKQAAQRDEPEKMIVPNTFAQVMSFTSFLFLMFKQNDKFFELTPTGEEDFGDKWKDCERVMDRDWRKSNGSKTLFQFLLDTARFGCAPLECSWVKESVQVYVVESQGTEVVLPSSGISTMAPAAGGYQTFLKFEGNRIRNVSPYRWFPDTSFSLSDFERGDFCASEEDFTMGGLRQLQKDGEVTGVDWIQPLPNDFNGRRGAESRFSFLPNTSGWSNENDAAPVVITKVRRKLVPKHFELEKEKALGPEDWPILYTVWIANDNRIIKCEPAKEWHQQLGYGLGEFTPDMHQTVSGSLAGLVYRLQDVISWFVNSHITSVRRVIQNRNVVNTSLIESKSYDGDGDIFIKKGVGKIDPRMVVSQLPATDVTAGHMGDVDILGKLMQMVSGVNDNAMGQYNSGRRSASESRVVTAGAAGRMKMHGHLLHEMGLGKIGGMMLSNSRQSLSAESFIRALGGAKDPARLQERYIAFQGTPQEIICGDDFLTFDSTLSSEKGFMAQNLQELLSIILQSNPLAAQQLTMKLDPMKLVSEMQYLRDGTPIERLQYSQEEQQMMLMQQQMAMHQQAATQSQPGVAA